MIEYRQRSLFDSNLSEEDEAGIVDNFLQYTLVQDNSDVVAESPLYKIFDEFDVLASTFRYKADALSMPTSEYDTSSLKTIFKNKVINLRKEKHEAEQKEKLAKEKAARANQPKAEKSKSTATKRYSYWDDDDYVYNGYSSYTPSYYSGSYGSYYGGNSDYWKKKTGYVEKYCNSDTLVFHKADPSTAMLSQIYDGKGWDVITDTYIDENEIKQLIEKHDRIICLGHGSPNGLIGGNIGPAEAPYLKGKKVFAIWCYAATYFKRNGLTGQGILCSDNAPSEVGEALYACNAHVSAKWMLDNITYWSKCMADVCEMALDGNPEEACKIAKENYYKSYADCQTDDERKVVEFNTNTIQVV